MQPLAVVIASGEPHGTVLSIAEDTAQSRRVIGARTVASDLVRYEYRRGMGFCGIII